MIAIYYSMNKQLKIALMFTHVLVHLIWPVTLSTVFSVANEKCYNKEIKAGPDLENNV